MSISVSICLALTSFSLPLSHFLWFSILTPLMSQTSLLSFKAMIIFISFMFLSFPFPVSHLLLHPKTVQWWTLVLVCPNVSSFVDKPDDVVAYVCVCVCEHCACYFLYFLYLCTLAAFCVHQIVVVGRSFWSSQTQKHTHSHTRMYTQCNVMCTSCTLSL